MKTTAIVIGMLLVACKDTSKNAAAQAEAQVYADQAARLSDTGARDMESAEAKELARLYEARRSQREELARLQDGGGLPDAGWQVTNVKNQLALVTVKLDAQRAKVERNREKLVGLEKDTRAQMARGDAGVSRDVLASRLEGITKSLAETNAALASEGR